MAEHGSPAEWPRNDEPPNSRGTPPLLFDPDSQPGALSSVMPPPALATLCTTPTGRGLPRGRAGSHAPTEPNRDSHLQSPHPNPPVPHPYPNNTLKSRSP